MNSTILELKENIQNKPPDFLNGEFNVNLKKHLTLKNGSSVIMRNIFIDTVASSGGMIDLDEPTDITMSFVRGFNLSNQMSLTDGIASDSFLIKPDSLGYVIDDNISAANVKNTHKFKPTDKGDSHIYYETIKSTVPAGNNKFRVAESMIFSSDFSDHYRDHYGGFNVLFQYIDINGKVQNYSTSLNNITSPKEGSGDALHSQPLGDSTFIYNHTVDFGNAGVKLVSPNASDMQKIHTTSSIIAFAGSDYDGGDVYTPNYKTVKTTIPAGAYSPDDLARLITDGFVQVDQDEDKVFTERELPYTTPILATTDEVCYSGNTGTKEALFISDSGQVATLLLENQVGITGNKVNKPITGASEFAFVFDGGEGGSQTFKFTSLHSPYYVNTASSGQPENLQIGNKLTPYLTEANTSNYLFFNDNKKGDILITSLEPFDKFWNAKLGIGSDIITQVSISDFKLLTSAGTPITHAIIKVPKFNIQVGVNMTEPFLGTDALVPKGLFLPQLSAYTSPILIPNLNTRSIYGNKTLSQITNTNGYFLIEIRGYNNGTRIIGSNNVDDISAIVSRFYTSPSYTNGYSSDSIVYTHQGQPVELSNFTVRILDPNRSPASGIGSNSCVYLLIEESSQNTPSINEV